MPALLDAMRILPIVEFITASGTVFPFLLVVSHHALREVKAKFQHFVYAQIENTNHQAFFST
jgi:hypothetical protein